MSLDIFNPEISVVAKGIEGKTMLIYGSNRLGKSSQACKSNKPFYLGFESGINAIGGVPFANIQRWSDFVKLNKQFTSPSTVEKAKEMYATIVFDTVQAAALLCQDYVCQQYDVNRIKDGNDSFGLWNEYASEFARQINLLTSAGYTVIFISHDATRKFLDDQGETYEKVFPAGDKRSIDPICDLVDIIIYVKANGMDENKVERKSSALLVNTPQYHAGSRFDYLPTYLKEFTMENLEKALEDAITKQEQEKTGSTASYSTYVETNTTVEIPFEQLVDEIGTIAKQLHADGKFGLYEEVVSRLLSKGAKVKEAKKTQRQQLELILDEIKLL